MSEKEESFDQDLEKGISKQEIESEFEDVNLEDEEVEIRQIPPSQELASIKMFVKKVKEDNSGNQVDLMVRPILLVKKVSSFEQFDNHEYIKAKLT